jgi:lipoprotein-anchoring transpeptidase ErfK/SrfK
VLVLASIGTATSAAPGDFVVPQPTQELATLHGSHTAMSSPDGRSRLRSIAGRRPITGKPTVLPVIGHATGADGVAWLHVRLPGRPNAQTGWITRRTTVATSTAWHLVVDLSDRRVTVYQRGRPVRVFSAVVGKSATPTPRGEFFVEEAIALQATDIGAPFALALSARSNVLRRYAGGPGQIALHGRDNVGGILGSATSHGCIRLETSAISWLAYRIGPGVPVTITG